MDAHLHSRFSRATSQNMNVDGLYLWAKYKGIDIIGTGDFTHPFWLAELKDKLEEDGSGLLRAKNSQNENEPKFILTSEISCIYTQGGKGRRIHLVVFAPSFGIVEKINEKLSQRGNLYADGRPIFGMSAKELAKIILDVCPECLIIPAHVWTPWFAIFGSNSGFDSVKECFEELTPQIYALETGLSSDPVMNWRLSALDKYALVSFSDAHSPANLGREAVVFEIAEKNLLSYPLIIKMIKEASPHFRSRSTLSTSGTSQDKQISKLAYTIEFFPEEGKYHFDGHRGCGVSLSPEESKKLNNKCPKCGRPLTIGVMHRVVDLADREIGFVPEKAVPYKSLVPLDEIIAESLKQHTTSQAVQKEYLKLVQQVAPELPLLLDFPLRDLEGKISNKIIEGIKKVRNGEVEKIPGYDGIYGIIKLKEIEGEPKQRQQRLF
jgi:PHP family Zn ribbon phosphoesterase